MSAKNDAIAEFCKIYEEEKEIYKVWGEKVKNHILDKLGYNNDINDFIKIPINVRVKETDSILRKAFYRKEKIYKDPINEITDKVGIRFVVMLQKQIKDICKIVDETGIWEASKDVDYEKNKSEFPELFVYQSVHYVVRNMNTFVDNGININKGIACEIQIRTLQQHAYAELSHDYIYKKGDEIDFVIKRYLARSMALNEATDDLFSEVYGMIEKENEIYHKLTEYLKTYYNFDGESEKINYEIYSNLKMFLSKYNVNEQQINENIKPYIIDKIKCRQNRILFRQPMIIFIYFLAKTHGSELLSEWYLPENELDMVYSDLGISNAID